MRAFKHPKASARNLGRSAIFVIGAFGISAAAAQQVEVVMNHVSASGIGDKAGTVWIVETKEGVSMKVSITGLAAGEHGFHVHEKGDCGASLKDGKMSPAEAAGPHYDPDDAKTHKGPKGEGHRGDLPALTMDPKTSEQTVVSHRIKLSDLYGRALVIHEAADNYTDQPENGGSASRVVCGVSPKQ